MIEQFTINTELPTLNDYIKAERGNRYAAAKLKKNATESVAWYATAQAVVLPENKRFDIEIDWYRKDNRHDSDNVFFAVKFILDGLTKAGSIPNDNPKVINNFRDYFTLCKEEKYVWCEVVFKKVKNV